MYAAETLIDEKALVLRLIDGDEDAFCELYAAYKGRLIYFAMRFLKSREHAEDVFQDAFTVIWQSRRFINPDASFSSYLYTIVRNRVLNQLRDLDNQNKLKEHVLAQAVDYTDETKNEILANDLRQLILRALQQLTPRQREYGAGVYILVIEIAARIFAEELGSGCRPRAASCLYEFVMKPIFLPYEIKNVKYTLDASLLRVLFF